MAFIFDTKVIKDESTGFKVTPSIDFTSYTLIYLIKKSLNDKDVDALISITPTLITENSLKKIIVEILPDTLKNITIGNYYHSLKVISPDKTKAITVFKGLLGIESEYIQNPVEVA